MLEEVEVFVNQPKLNKEVEANQIRIKMKADERLKSTGGYVNYYFRADDGQEFKGTFECNKKDEDEFIHSFAEANVDAWFKKDFIKQDLNLKLKKTQAMFYKKELDSQAIKLSGLSLRSVLEKLVKLDKGTLTVEIMIQKAVK